MNVLNLKDYTQQDKADELLGQQIVDAAFQVHSTLGPGLLESVYETCLLHEFAERKIIVAAQKPIDIIYKNKKIDAAFKCDLYIGDSVIVELKAVDAVLPIHEAQLLTYMKLMDKRLGYLINFNVPLIKDGIKRMIRRK